MEVVHFQRDNLGVALLQDQPGTLVARIHGHSVGEDLGLAPITLEMERSTPAIASTNDVQLAGRVGPVRRHVAHRGVIE